MWRIETRIQAGRLRQKQSRQHTSAECGNRGYRNIKPVRSHPVLALRPGDAHALRAEMNGADLRVYADNTLVWQGWVGPNALAFDGPVGIRSDNARLQIALHTAEPIKAPPGDAPACRSVAGEPE